MLKFKIYVASTAAQVNGDPEKHGHGAEMCRDVL